MKTSNESLYGFVWETGYSGIPILINATKRVREKGWFLPRVVKDYWIFDYSISDYGKCKVGKRSRVWQERPARVGHLYPPHVPYAEDLRQAPKPVEEAWITFRNGEKAGLPRLIQKKYAYARFLDPDGLCLPLLEKIALIGKEEERAGFWNAQAALCEIIGLLLSARHVNAETYAITSGKQKSNYSPWLAAVQEYLSAARMRPLQLREMARHFNVSQSTLCHRYRAETGQSPVNAHARMRIELVKNLLLKGQKLKEIAEEAGFCDPYHLSRRFKQIVGLPPHRFVDALTKNAN